MNTRGVQALLAAVQLGASISTAAGPKGRDAAASMMQACRPRCQLLALARSVYGIVARRNVSAPRRRRQHLESTARLRRTIVAGTETLVTPSGAGWSTSSRNTRRVTSDRWGFYAA